jgi:hypothetical protein
VAPLDAALAMASWPPPSEFFAARYFVSPSNGRCPDGACPVSEASVSGHQSRRLDYLFGGGLGIPQSAALGLPAVE